MFNSRDGEVDLDQYERQSQTFAWASFEDFSGIANILLAVYFIYRFCKLSQVMNETRYKSFAQSVSLSIAAVFASIVVSSVKILAHLDVLLLAPGWSANTWSCGPDSCIFCTILQKIGIVNGIFRNCCIYLVFLQSIESHFNTSTSLQNNNNSNFIKSSRNIKICLISSQFALSVILGIFMTAKLYRLADSNHTACYRNVNAIITVSGSINGTFLLLALIIIIIVFFKQSRKVLYLICFSFLCSFT